MRDRTLRIISSWAFIGSCLMVMACGTSTPAPPDPQADGGTQTDGGTQPPDGGTDPEQPPPECNVPAPTTCPDPAPRYADVAPIFEQRCLICHSGWEGPWPLDNYGHVADWQDTIRSNLLDCTMPPPDAKVPITLAERLAILTWIRCGLPK